MTKIVINLLLILSIPITAAAAPEPGNVAGKHHGGLLGRLSQELGLTDAQKAKAKELYQENKLKTQAKREEIKEKCTVTLSFNTNHFRLNLMSAFIVNKFKICRFAASCRSVVHNLRLKYFIFQINKCQSIYPSS